MAFHIAYHFRQGFANDRYASADQFKWVRVEREQSWGRPLGLHFYDKQRDGQTRGVSRLAPIMEKLRMEDQYSRVELQAAVINAALAAYIKSPMDTEALMEMLGENENNELETYTSERTAYHKERGGVKLAGAKLPHLFPGEEIDTIKSARPSAQFASFESAVLRNIASGMGISYEQLATGLVKDELFIGASCVG